MDLWLAVALFWVLHALWVLAALLSLRRPRPASTAAVTVVIAARDEEARIGETLRRAAGHPTIVAEGPSRDGTRRIVQDSHATLVPLDHVPEGWVGKVAALQAATGNIETEWIAFVDADVHLAPGALPSLIEAAGDADFAVVYPGQRCQTIPGRATHYALGQGMLFLSPPWLVHRGIGTAGLGHLILVRRAAYEAMGRHEPLRRAILDDVAFGRHARRHGARIAMVSGTDHAESDWAASAAAVLQATRKNAFAALGYRPWLALLMAFGYGAATLAGAVGWAFGPAGWLATAAWSLQIIPSAVQETARLGWGPGSRTGAIEARWRRAAAVLLSPIAWGIYAVLPLYSMWTTLRHGIEWRGTRYDWRQMR